MRNHIHLLVKIANSIKCSRGMQALQLAYFHYFRRRYGYVGRFWQGRFYSKVVEDERYFLTAALYAERNPVKAGLVASPDGVKDPLITIDPSYSDLASNAKERQKMYRKMMDEFIKMEKDASQYPATQGVRAK